MQAERHERQTRTLRPLLLAGAAWLVCVPFAAAQTTVDSPRAPLASPAPAVQVAPVSDGLTPEALYVEADSVERTGDVVTARGSDQSPVYARSRGHVLRGENLAYDLAQGTATVEGNVAAIAPDGTTVHASYLELDENLTTGIAVDFATRFQNGASLMAATAVRRGEFLNQLNYAVFTPCPTCDANGPKTPSVSIQAQQVTQDEALRAILYRNAVFRIGGVPVFYTPFFAHPDPSVERASGFLIPLINFEEGRGLSVEAPYYHVVSPSEDWLISPQINSRVVPLLNLQWRRRFERGTVVARGGYTYERNFGDFDLNGDGVYENNVRFGDRTHRSYLLAHGKFDFEGPWRAGFTAERTSDKTLFDRYDVRNPYQDNGLYYGDRRRLISQAYIERQTDRSYMSVAAFSLQSLRLDPRFASTDFRDSFGNKVFERDTSLPLVAPLIEARWEPESEVFGGRLRLKGSSVSVFREAFIGSPVLNPALVPTDTTGLPGVDSLRVTGQVEWRRAMIAPMGIRWEPFFDARVDYYSLSHLPQLLGLSDKESFTRSRFSGGLDVSYPLIRRTSRADIILEPVGQLSYSNRPENDPRIPNEDAQGIELDESSLFRMDRFTGYDLIEGGTRFTAGGRATIRWSAGRSASLFVGRSHRFDEEASFVVGTPDNPNRLYDPSGLASHTSDWVVQGSVSLSQNARGWGHATIDGNGDVRRAQSTIDGRWGRRNSAAISYILDRSNPVPGPLNRNYEFVQLAGQQFVYRNWGVTAAGIADLAQDEITRSEVGLLFDDDCFRFEIGYRRDNTRVRPSGPADGIYVRLNLATFGGSGYGQSELR